MKKCIFVLALLCSFSSFSQNAVQVGSGSYATEPDPSEDNSDLWTSRKIWVSDTNTRPIPTNDWWTSLITQQFGGNLWAHPFVMQPDKFGLTLYSENTWAGQDMVMDYPLKIKAANFLPASAIAKDWSDWTVVMNMAESSGEYMDVTIGHGMPYIWLETMGLNPQIEAGAGYKVFDELGNDLSLPIITDHFGIEYQGNYFGVFLTSNTTINDAGAHTLLLNTGTGKSSVVLAAMPAKSDLGYYYQYAYAIPRHTTVSYDYQPNKGTIQINWEIAAQNLKGGVETEIIQGFIPHHYKRDILQTTVFNNKTYNTPRGLMKCAIGNRFEFSYRFNGVLPYLPAPKHLDLPNPYDADRMNKLIDDYATKTGYGNDTYWGVKDPFYYAQYMQMAKETGNLAAFENLKSKTKESLIDWFTYSPGEKEHYFARYENWRALIGFDPSYGSQEFSDNHFHYGYFTHAAALLGFYDNDFLEGYGEMAKLVAKQYANWDRSDKNFPYFRTFDLWEGHSWAAGPDGSNQESSSEAMQSWGGMFYLGCLLNDQAMRDAAVFGYVQETQATLEYWFDVDGENLPSGYGHNAVGILWCGAVQYGTWFSGEPIHIRGIQWLPISPILNYMAMDTAYARANLNELMHDSGNPDIATWGSGWGNVVLSYIQMFDPDFVALKFDTYWTDNLPVVKDIYTSGITYYLTHSNRHLGAIKWDHYTSMPMSTVYYNSDQNLYTYVAYNPENTDQTCTVYNYNGAVIGSFVVPAKTMVSTHLDSSTLVSVGIRASTSIIDVGQTLQFTVIGYDQYGAVMPVSGSQWSVSAGGIIDPNGLFTAQQESQEVVVTVDVSGMTAHTTIRVGKPAYVQTFDISPGLASVPLNGSQQFVATATNQYGDPVPVTKVVWSVEGQGTISQSGLYVAGNQAGPTKITATLAGVSTSALAVVHTGDYNLALNKNATASSANHNTTAMAFDGSTATRWESNWNDAEWLSVDLGAHYDISEVVIQWEPAYSSVYTIDISDDGSTWQSIHNENAGTGGVETISVSATGRYIRVNATQRGTVYGHSIWELEVYGALGEPNASSIVVTPPAVTICEGATVQFNAYGFNDKWNATTINGDWLASEGSIDQNGLFTAHSVGGPYTITYNDDGLTGTALVYVIPDTAAMYMAVVEGGEATINRLFMYPNPVRDYLYVKASNPIDEVRVYSVTGKLLVLNQPVGEPVLDLSGLSKGVYIVQMQAGGRFLYGRIVKE